jgi:mono/diheme cytochrome c family protein
MKKFAVIILVGLGIVIVSFAMRWNSNKIEISKSDRVDATLVLLGDTKPLHYIDKLDTSKIRMGRELVLSGRTVGPDGNKTKFQSNYFVCTDCHNVVQEDPNLKKPNPDDRLAYAIANKIPFLQGTTLHGVVNRQHWYNDDYAKKYGALVAPTRDTLVNAVQLCATTCSQGREFTDWELEAVMHYLTDIGYKMSDLDISDQELKATGEVVGRDDASDGIDMLKTKYAAISHATFLDPMSTEVRKLGSEGKVENGKLIYDNSCLHCHMDGGVTNFILADEKPDYQYLKNSMAGNTHGSIYYIARKGTYALNGYHPYMPNYTLERMSHQQLEDLAAFINQMAKK